MRDGELPIVNMVGKGLKIASDDYSPAITYDNSIASKFDHMSGMTWDGDALTPLACTINLRQNAKPIEGYDGRFQDINGQKPVFGTIVAECNASQGEVAFADWEAKAAKIFTVSLGKSAEASHSIAGTFENARLVGVREQEIFGKEPIYTLLMMLQTSSFEVTDGI